MKNFSASNCLSTIRIIAALQVILGHMIEHFELPGNATFLHTTYFFRGVPIFFVISGFLMEFSIVRSRSYGEYLKKRFWRIYPELWVAVLIEIIAVVVFYKEWEIKSLVPFLFAQGTIFQFWTPDSLRGYGVGTPNGALWTIGVMVQFYIIAWFFQKMMKDRKLPFWVTGFVLSLIVSLGGSYIFQNILKIEIADKLFAQTCIKYFWLFYFGLFLARYEKRVLPILQRYWYILLVIAAVFFWTQWDLDLGYGLGWSLFLTAGLIGFAYRYPGWSISPDISYGLFLYHMIVVNIYVQFGWTGRWVYAVSAACIAIVLALLSTVTVGKISARKKSKSLSCS